MRYLLLILLLLKLKMFLFPTYSDLILKMYCGLLNSLKKEALSVTWTLISLNIPSISGKLFSFWKTTRINDQYGTRITPHSAFANFKYLANSQYITELHLTYTLSHRPTQTCTYFNCKGKRFLSIFTSISL